MFEGVCGNSFTGDIALDDITFTVGAGSCPLQPNDGEGIEFRLFFRRAHAFSHACFSFMLPF